MQGLAWSFSSWPAVQVAFGGGRTAHVRTSYQAKKVSILLLKMEARYGRQNMRLACIGHDSQPHKLSN